MLTPHQVAEFEQYGLLPLPQQVPAAEASTMRNRLWDFLSTHHGRQRDDPRTWKAIEGRSGFKTLMRTGAFDTLQDHVAEPVTDLLGPGRWSPPTHWGHPLVTFPNAQEWEIPATGWHVDSHRWSTGKVPGLVVFSFLDEVRPRGGGTLVMPGSHHLTWRLCREAGGFMKTTDMKAALVRNYPWFADLWRVSSSDSDRRRGRLNDGPLIDGVPLRVAELCGRAGDVVLMNPRILHATAPNTLDSPRMMLSDFIDRHPDH